MLPSGARRVVDSMGALLVTVIAFYVAFNAMKMGWLTTGQTSGSGLPLEWTFYPMGAGALFMTVFALEIFCARPIRESWPDSRGRPDRRVLSGVGLSGA
jgi:hypothetical protein